MENQSGKSFISAEIITSTFSVRIIYFSIDSCTHTGTLPLVSRQLAPCTIRPDNSPPIFKQLAPRSFIHYRAKRAAKYMYPRLNVIQINRRSFIHYRTNYSPSFIHYRVWRSGASCLRRIVQWASCLTSIVKVVTVTDPQLLWHSWSKTAQTHEKLMSLC